ncbi:MAG: hypothetical protein IKX42_11580 [Fibrobacter sp.]|nr:hypothetical protein [Fibrobacter sp.]
MKKRHLYIYLPILAGLFFWACGSGSLEWAENDDILALEKFDKFPEDSVLVALEKCVASGECDKESSEAFKRSLLARDSIEEDTVESSSSAVDLFGLSSSSDSSIVSSSGVVLSSSSGADLLSSSGEVLSSTSDSLSSSAVLMSSSGPVVSSSSKPLISSSSVVLSSSSFIIKLSSSSAPPVVSSSNENDPCTQAMLEKGQCTVTPGSIKLGGKATWSYAPVFECRSGLTATWQLPEADVVKKTGLSVEFEFTDDNVVGQKVYPTLTVKRGALSVTMECDKAQLKIEAGVIPSSSSIIRSSSSSVIKSSSSIIPITDECKMDPMDNTGTIWLCQKPGRESEQCNYVSQKWVCPTGPVVSSSSIVPSSSSVIPPSSSSVVPPSSSSVVSSSSQGPIEIQMTSNVRTQALDANQDYAVTYSCGTLQVLPPGGNNMCHVTVDGQTYDVGWDKQISTGPGTFIVSCDCDGFSLNCW